ncbi:MAG: prepilin peptidase [Campylobacterota bacterium]|nr:prepilin peptidase [Campylobacterota bacterium]
MELLLIFVLGTLIGSFMNVVIIRIPKEESVVFPASHCVSCDAKLKPWHNIPLVSWLMLRGKCSFCGAPISKQYPIVELLSGIIFVLVFMKMGISIPTLGIAIVFLLLLALSVIDFYYKMVPDSLNLLALTLAIVSVYSFPMFVEHGVHALLFAGGFTLLRFYLSYIIKKEAMGEADIMIAATMGALLGIKLTLAAIFISALLALPAMLLLRDEKDEESLQVPFIPFLAMATLLVFIFDMPIMNYLDSLYG